MGPDFAGPATDLPPRGACQPLTPRASADRLLEDMTESSLVTPTPSSVQVIFRSSCEASDAGGSTMAGRRDHTVWFPWLKMEPPASTCVASVGEEVQAFEVRTRMASRRGCAQLTGPGRPENLIRSEWSKGMADHRRDAGEAEPTRRPLATSLEAGGVGTGSRAATSEARCRVPFDCGGRAIYGVPELLDSEVPALVGQPALKQQRAPLDCFDGKLDCVGPGRHTLSLHPGTRAHDLERMPAGHLTLAFCSFKTTGSTPGSRAAPAAHAGLPPALSNF